MWNDLSEFSVLVTGGTKGLGLATALAFARAGAHVTITHKWGSVSDDEITAQFEAVDARAPLIVCADVASAPDIEELLERIDAAAGRLDVFVSNVAFAQLPKVFEDYTRRGLRTSIDYSVWPLIAHLQAIHERFETYPRYVVAMSSCGAETYHANYDFAAVTKAMNETFCRYLSKRLLPEGTHVNAIRTRYVATDSLEATVGGFADYVRDRDPTLLSSPDDVASAVLGLCAGPMDAVNGQVLTVDGGASFHDNLMGAFERSKPQSNPRSNDGT